MANGDSTRKGPETVGPAGAGAQGAGAADGGEARGNLQGENTRLRQEVAKLQDLNQKALPFVQFVTALEKTDKGKEIVQKFVKGEDFSDLLGAEKRAVEKAAGETAGITLDQVKEIVSAGNKETVEMIRAGRAAERSSEILDNWAKDEFPGYEKLRGTPAWNGYMDAVFAAMHNGTLVAAEGDDPWKFAIRKAYAMCVAENPEIAKGKKAAASKPEERAAEILSAGRKPPSSKALDTNVELPEDYQKKIDFIKGIGSGMPGKKF